MKYRTCHDAYQSGVNSRADAPLRAGLYKLGESKDRIDRLGKEVVCISEVINNVRHPAELEYCTFEDMGRWLKTVPSEVAFMMGYGIIPSLRALEFDGVTRLQAESAAKFIEAAMRQRLAQWDALRNSYKKEVACEYERMRGGQSNALKVVDDALDLIDTATYNLPSNIQWHF
jgi:hypothetical protein